ncbi:alpha/beta fold hydrolase [Geodermatophilus marinus]|uniref:alpha/beta fold hydrolase n=1 Tax=Geodermatophilus sp. LHW52908 TaxID=2303986 RepID=UPI000E3E86E2|nr:alpha/beta hydrolase family protein [Geodermatophilus sp. LHW52908]RFU21850.1 alpha/beta fold hydrolase [Geodermatophilus sp. LHW52908]
MTTTAPTTTAPTTTAPTTAAGRSTAGRGSRRGPIRRIIATSLGTGTVLAAVLTLVVFAGGPEPVITGSALLGFAVGWAVLAVLSARLTDQPQRWALVPAAVLAASGLGLLVLAPDDRVLTAAGWAWPPALLALTLWIGLRIRRSLAAGSGRRLLYPVVLVMAAAAVGGAVETVGLAADQRAYPMPGQAYDVGGHRLHLDCTGSGSPTVVLHSGLGETSAHWARIAPAAGGATRVCAYDRAGQGWSDDAPRRRQDGLQAAADLHTLLDRAGEHGPYVLVGHSIGGDHAMTYAARYPEQVAGMVLLDATSPYTVGDDAAHTGPPSAVALLPSLARLGIGRLLPTSSWSALPDPAAAQVQAFAASPRGWRNLVDEVATLPALLTQARALATLGSTPLVMLTAAGHDGDPARAAAHDRMAGLSTNSSHRLVGATHAGLVDEEHGAALSVQAVADVVQAARAGSPLPPN